MPIVDDLLLIILMLITPMMHGADNAYKKVVATTHVIHIEDALDPGSKGHCSATAIGPHAILTAGHCVENSNVIAVDAEHATIDSVINDGCDHALLLLSGVEFKFFVAPTPRDFEISETVFMVGNPAELTRMYRRGEVAGVEPLFEKDTRVLVIIDINGFFGDSGAGVFDQKGNLIGVFSVLRYLHRMEEKAVFVGVVPLHFTKEQLDFAEVHGTR